MYSINIEMFARAEPLILSESDLQADHAGSLQELVEYMETCDAEEAQDQVHESYKFDLCASCRNRMHRQLKSKAKYNGKTS